jgi:sterol desaturase/sphingolipid hydroxylase (fatty acid hydroxylase superfamily)
MTFETLALEHESAIRLGFFLATLLLLAGWELIAPLRAPIAARSIRWSNHIVLLILNMVLLRLAFPVAAAYVALAASERGTGLFNMLPVAYPVAVVASLLAFDLSVYLVHRVFHGAPLFWRMHRLHHADLDVDVATAVRFHPIQMVLSVLIKLAVILALGTPVLAVLVFETVFHIILLFSHANVRIAPAVDRVLRWFIVTPDMHRVHHSVQRAETDSNFGFALPWWDRLFGTYRAEPAAGHERMTVGIERFRTRRDLWLGRMLLNPFVGSEPSSRELKPQPAAVRR